MLGAVRKKIWFMENYAHGEPLAPVLWCEPHLLFFIFYFLIMLFVL